MCPNSSSLPVAYKPVADHTLVRLPWAAWSRLSRACGVGTGVEPATASSLDWCSTSELTWLTRPIGQNPCTEHTLPTVVKQGACAVGLAVSETPVGIEPTQSCFAGSRLTVWLQRQVIQCPRQESNLVFDLRRVACDPQHSEDILSSAPPRNRTSSGSFEDCHAFPAHPQGVHSSVSTRIRTWIWTFGLSYAIPCTIETFSTSIPTWSRTRRAPPGSGGRGFRKALCEPLHHRDELSEPTTGFAPAWSGLQDRRLSQSSHVGNSSRSARSRTPSGGFGIRILSQEDTPVSAPGLATGDHWRNNYSFSVTFQYASLMNFDQLSIRMLWSA